MKLPTQKQRELLVKFLGMSGSSGDGEALTAIRMANKLLRELEATWADVISGRFGIEIRTEVRVQYPSNPFRPHQPQAPTRPQPFRASPQPPSPGYASGPRRVFTRSSTGATYDDNLINLMFAPLHSFPFSLPDSLVLTRLWQAFVRARRLEPKEFDELRRLTDIVTRQMNRQYSSSHR